MNPTAELEGWSEEDLSALLREDERPLKCDRCDGTGSYHYSDGQGGGYTEPCESYSWPGYGLMASRLAEARGTLAEARAENERLSMELKETERYARGRDVACHRVFEVATTLEAERDAAIERGVAVWKGAEQQRGMLLLLLWMRTVEHDDDHEALDRAEAREKTLREALEKSRWMVALLGRRYVKGEDEGGCMTCDRWVDTEGHSESCEYAAMVTFMKSARAALEGE